MSKMICEIILVLLLQSVLSYGAPLPVIFQAQPQVIMHTLQQPIPIETLASLKTKNNQQKNPWGVQSSIFLPRLPQTHSEVLQELAKIQAMQPMQHSVPKPLQTQSPILTSNILNQMTIENLQPTMSFLNQEIPIQINQNHQAMMDYQNQVAEDAMQEIALQQQMLALQQIQALKQLNTEHLPFGLYPSQQSQPILLLLPNDEDEKDGSSKDLTENTQNYNSEDNHTESLEEDLDSIAVGEELEEPNENTPHKEKGMRKAILFIPNAKFSIGGIISLIPWLPIEVNVPDTAIWAWNGIYNGISSIISIIGGNLPFGTRRPQLNGTTEPSVKMFLKKLQSSNYEPIVPVYAVPL